MESYRKDTQVKKFIVYREDWHRGKGAHGSKLIREEDDKLCCLGFLALQCGMPAHKILGKGFFSEVSEIAAIPEKVVKNQYDIGKLNDKESLDDREEQLTKFFKDFCYIDVEFMDGKMPEPLDYTVPLTPEIVKAGLSE